MHSILEHLACSYPPEESQEGRFFWEKTARGSPAWHPTGKMCNFERAAAFLALPVKVLRFFCNRLIFARHVPITQSGTLKQSRVPRLAMNTNHLADDPIVTAKDAIASHMRWKITLQLAIALNEPLSPSAIRSIQHSEECPIGRWLVSQHTLSVRNTEEYRDLAARHEEIHREVAQIASLINNRKYGAARRALDPNSSFRRASQAMASAIMALDSIQTIAIAS
jgi:hypothetical protein